MKAEIAFDHCIIHAGDLNNPLNYEYLRERTQRPMWYVVTMIKIGLKNCPKALGITDSIVGTDGQKNMDMLKYGISIRKMLQLNSALR